MFMGGGGKEGRGLGGEIVEFMVDWMVSVSIVVCFMESCFLRKF